MYGKTRYARIQCGARTKSRGLCCIVRDPTSRSLQLHVTQHFRVLSSTSRHMSWNERHPHRDCGHAGDGAFHYRSHVFHLSIVKWPITGSPTVLVSRVMLRVGFSFPCTAHRSRPSNLSAVASLEWRMQSRKCMKEITDVRTQNQLSTVTNHAVYILSSKVAGFNYGTDPSSSAVTQDSRIESHDVNKFGVAA